MTQHAEGGSRRWLTAAAAWGFAEATLFFLVPDILLSWIALERPKRAVLACLVATAGALLGGALMYAWGRADTASARAVMETLPGITPVLADRVDADLSVRGLQALALGPARGVPYKLYAVGWGELGGGLLAFLAVSIPARLARFLVIAMLAAAIRRFALAGRSLAVCRLVHLAAWTLFYAWYFRAMAG